MLCARPLAVLVLGLALLPGCKSPDPDSRARLKPETPKGGRLVDAVSAPDSGSSTSSSAPTPPAPVVLPASGKVFRTLPGFQFVIIDYTLGGMPPLESVLSVYRGDQKVGSVRLTGPERNGFVAADIVEGFLQVDDEVRLH